MILEACLAALLTAQTADAVTTARLHYPQMEGNPFLPRNQTGAVAVKAAATGALVAAGWRIRHQHRTLACVLFAAGAVSGSYGAIHNLRLQ